MKKQWVVVYGSLSDGLQGVVGPFETEDEAEEYMESHNLGHYDSFIEQLDTPL